MYELPAYDYDASVKATLAEEPTIDPYWYEH